MIRLASKQAKQSTFEKHKLGAVIVKGNRVLSSGYNEIRYSKELRKSNIHAEEAAILKLLKSKRFTDLVGADIYVSRVMASGKAGLAKPCSRCAELIKSVGVSTVYYTDYNGGIGTYRT